MGTNKEITSCCNKRVTALSVLSWRYLLFNYSDFKWLKAYTGNAAEYAFTIAISTRMARCRCYQWRYRETYSLVPECLFHSSWDVHQG